MHFNIYLDDETGTRLTHLAQRRNRSRNSVVREAVADLLARQSGNGWPDIVLGFQGLGDIPQFESYRDELAPADDDPLGGGIQGP